MKYIIPMIVGAVIGYATNWMAIKMLFRPHYEKRVLGMKIPFTPGLIPKEKKRIAKNIGEAVGEYLLSPKAIAETLGSSETKEEIEIWFRSRIDKAKDEEKSIKELLYIFGDRYEEIIKTIERLIHNLGMKLIRDERIKERILDFIKEKLHDDKVYEEISRNIKMFLETILKSEKTQIVIEGNIEKEFQKISKDERILKEALPEKVKWELNLYLDDNSEEIGNNIRKIMKSKDVQYKLKQSISNIVDQNVSRLITSFIPAEAISEKIYIAIEKYIDDENSNNDIVIIIKLLLENIMESKVSELTSGILKKVNPMDLSNYILEYIGSVENKETIVNMIDGKIKEVDPEMIIEKLSKEIDLILNGDKLEKEISIFIKGSLLEFLDRPVIGILNKLEDNFYQIYDYSKIIFDGFLINQFPEIIELFNISKIVEDEINGFGVEFTEKLILDIARKELRAITWLGALLGSIMGLLSPLLQML